MPLEGADRPLDLALVPAADDLVGEVEEGVEANPLAVPHPDAAVSPPVAEVLKRVVRRLAGLAPGAFESLTRARTRSTSPSWNVYIPVYV